MPLLLSAQAIVGLLIHFAVFMLCHNVVFICIGENEMIVENQLAPEFSVQDQNGDMVNLSDFNGIKNVVIYFYPKDDTPGCTVQANQFTALVPEFQKFDTEVLGVSKDDIESHTCFINKFNLKIKLLADIDGVMSDAYGVWQDKEKNGVTSKGMVRSTFVINKQGTVLYSEYGVTADGHAQKILEIIKNTE